jgi:hypothetical protein
MGPSHGGPITVNRRHPCDQRLRGLRSVDVARRGSRRERTSLLDFGGRDLRGTPIYASRTPRVDGIGVGRRRLVPRRGADRGGREGHRGGGAVRALTRVCLALRRALRAERTGRTDGQNGRCRASCSSRFCGCPCVRRVVASSRPDPPSSSLNASARFAELVALRRRSRWGAKAVLSARATRRPKDPSSHSPLCCCLFPPLILPADASGG